MEQLREGEVVEGRVEGYNAEGYGVLRVGGAVVFVPRAIQGEEIRCRIARVTTSAASGELLQILTPSPKRREPDCPYFPLCGGCDLRHMSYDEELAAKRQRVQDALARIGRSAVRVEDIAPAPSPLRYRNKAIFPISPDADCGFYQRHSHQVVPVQTCLLLTPAAAQIARAVELWATRYHVPPYEESSGRGLLRYVYVRTSRRGQTLVCLVVNARKLPREPELVALILQAAPKTVGVLLNANTKKNNVILTPHARLLWGQDFLEDSLCGLKFRISVSSFYQVNPAQTEMLYQKVLDFADLSGHETVLDLYCGIGTITLLLAQHARYVTGSEINPAAVRNARYNAQYNQITNVRFYEGDASRTAAFLRSENLRPEIIVVDPPRKGLAPDVIQTISALQPERVIYVSCDPATLGRDISRFSEQDYHAVRAFAVDMFPRTKHVETVCLLCRHHTE